MPLKASETAPQAPSILLGLGSGAPGWSLLSELSGNKGALFVMSWASDASSDVMLRVMENKTETICGFHFSTNFREFKNK